MKSFRVGHGYDVHRLVDNRDFMLCGVKLDYHKGLLGHSDADVGLHAIMDALLGAAGLGDIGKFFPDSDNKYKDIDSKILLQLVSDKLLESGLQISNIDCTVVLQAPKISGYISEMKSTIANILNIGSDQVNIKATTEEGLGFTGEGLGVAAHAVVLIYN